MNMFTNVSSQVSGLGTSLGSWFKKDGKPEDGTAAEGQEGEAKKDQTTPQEQPSPASANASEQSVKGSADENEDAASQHSGKKVCAEGQEQAVESKASATEGADSNPPSEAEEEPEAKAGFASALEDMTKAWEVVADYGRQLEVRLNRTWDELDGARKGFGLNLSAVQGRASASAKSVGSFFSTAFSKAGASVKEAGSKIKESVEKNTLLTEFNKEQEAFIKAKGGKGGEALPPWVGYPDEDSLKEEILALSTDRRNFVRSPPTGVSFEFDLEAFLPVAQATLAADPNLEKMRFELVPKAINEEAFWRNYFYRVGLIRQSTELSSLEREGVDASSKSAADGDKEEDWEKELREELGEALGEYEVVGGAGKDNEKWEEEIQNMIDDEDSGDLR
ncbi:synapse-associated protein of 47 kDa-like isoform X9 [Palaemon carinicauda]|uniref:synapse-associated protein of 47 kDa-like isoform X9 n=1 Tax=Palaemon carinicauda TaxID=392227 RepID=UPI0035B61353